MVVEGQEKHKGRIKERLWRRRWKTGQAIIDVRKKDVMHRPAFTFRA